MKLSKKRVVKKDVREKKTHQRTAIKPVVKKEKKQAEVVTVAPKNTEIKPEKPEIKRQHRQPKPPKPVEDVVEVVNVVNDNIENNEQNI